MKKQKHISHIALHTSQKGITLIALIITIIVMLILVGVTVTVALNGGLFSKAEEATTKTKIAQIQEALTLKRAEVLAEYDGKTPENYGITIADLNLPEQLKKEYETKLIISKDAILYYDASVVTDIEEQNIFKSMGIEEYVETNTGNLANSYTFTLAEFVVKEGVEWDGAFIIPLNNFWKDEISEELKNSTIIRKIGSQELVTYNITCSNKNYTNAFDYQGDINNGPNLYQIVIVEETLMFAVTDKNGELVTFDNYTNYADLAFTISMAE